MSRRQVLLVIGGLMVALCCAVGVLALAKGYFAYASIAALLLAFNARTFWFLWRLA